MEIVFFTIIYFSIMLFTMGLFLIEEILTKSYDKIDLGRTVSLSAIWPISIPHILIRWVIRGIYELRRK